MAAAACIVREHGTNVLDSALVHVKPLGDMIHNLSPDTGVKMRKGFKKRCENVVLSSNGHSDSQVRVKRTGRIRNDDSEMLKENCEEVFERGEKCINGPWFVGELYKARNTAQSRQTLC
jgi:hypothetical protein